MGGKEGCRRRGAGNPKKKLKVRKRELEDGISELVRKMERFSHPCDRGEFAHLLAEKRRELAELEETLTNYPDE